ncbi:MAG: sigma-70 family RNA polymerase sigma factor, partial [Acidobacteria bacterium]|nr:sigma-70 family RNA polymerase sigma factor [Acidobacteriota bacterium]
QRMSSSSPAPEEEAEARAELDDVLTALGSLRPFDQEILRLAAFEGLSSSEIAHVLGLPASRVRTNLYRARKRLQRALDETRGR